MNINLLISVSCFIFWCSMVQAGSEYALLYGAIGVSQYPSALDIKSPPMITACPAANAQGMKFNEEVSISGESLFVKNVCKKQEALDNLKLNVCRNPIKPVTFYDLGKKIYEIGYELYHREGQLQLVNRPQDLRFDHYVKVIFHRVAMPSKPPNNYSHKHRDNQNIKFKFVNGSTTGTLVFHFIPVWHIEALEKSRTKKITFRDWHLAIDEEYNHASQLCDSYRHLRDEITDDLYSEENQRKCLKDLWIPPSSQFAEHTSTSNFPCGHPYGCLKKAQMIPAWYSNKHAIKLTYCTCMNFVPIWETIANGQLKKVDALVFLIINAVRNNWDYDGKINITEVNFGVSGILTMKKKDNLEEPQEIHLWNGENDCYTIPVPKIIFKIIRIQAFDKRSVIIIVHNDPNPVSDSDRICSKESEIPGWDMIKNENPRTGLTYACHLTPEVIDTLELQGTTPILDYPFNLEGYLPKEVMSIKKKFDKIISV